MHIQRNFELSYNQPNFLSFAVMEREKVQEWTMENAFKRNFFRFHGFAFSTQFH